MGAKQQHSSAVKPRLHFGQTQFLFPNNSIVSECNFFSFFENCSVLGAKSISGIIFINQKETF